VRPAHLLILKLLSRKGTAYSVGADIGPRGTSRAVCRHVRQQFLIEEQHAGKRSGWQRIACAIHYRLLTRQLPAWRARWRPQC
jgi:hypothetical protein